MENYRELYPGGISRKGEILNWTPFESSSMRSFDSAESAATVHMWQYSPWQSNTNRSSEIVKFLPYKDRSDTFLWWSANTRCFRQKITLSHGMIFIKRNYLPGSLSAKILHCTVFVLKTWPTRLFCVKLQKCLNCLEFSPQDAWRQSAECKTLKPVHP